MKINKNANIGFRTTNGVRKAIEAVAAKERRSISQMVEIFVVDSLEVYGKEHPDFTAHLSLISEEDLQE